MSASRGMNTPTSNDTDPLSQDETHQQEHGVMTAPALQKRGNADGVDFDLEMVVCQPVVIEDVVEVSSDDSETA